MKTTAATVWALCLLPAVSAWAGLEEERGLIQRDPTAAMTRLQEKLTQMPGDPYLLYNTAVAAYAAKEFSKADELWQQLAATQMPEPLREQVWLQIGNVSYRLVQGEIEKAPDSAVARLEQSREAFRVALAFNKKNQTAGRNLELVEKELEKIYARLAKRLADEGKKENYAPRAIEKLQAALTYAQQAEALNKKDQQRQEERKDIEKALAQKFDQRAAQEEKTADQRNPEKNNWEREDAEEHLRNAMADFQQAASLDPQDQVAKDGERRVQEKLANLLAKAGRKDQQQAQQLAQNAPPQAMEKLESALENFQEALAIQPDHADAKAGEKEVSEQLERMHLEQGDRLAEQGKQQLPRNPEAASENLAEALQNFEAAQALDPQNGEVAPRIAATETMLAEALTKAGQRQQQRGERSEQQNNIERAVANFEQAEASFAQAEAKQPGNKEAQEGQQQVQAALARLRQQLAQKAEQQQPGKPQNQQQAQQSQETFQSMLARLKEDLKDREVQARHGQGQKYNEERNRNLRNW
jgi:tetratricopeptide (TPR) repeat protein